MVLLLLGASGSAWAEPKAEAGAGPEPTSEALVIGVDPELENVAHLFIEKGDFAAALEIFDELRDAHPNNFELLDVAIDLCRKIPACKPRQLKLLKVLEAFVHRNPKSAEARTLLADYAVELKQFDNALRAIKLLIEAKPGSLANWLLLLDHYDGAKDFKQVDKLLLDLRKRFPKSAEVWFRVADRALAIDARKETRVALAKSKRLLRKTDAELRLRRDALERELTAMIRAETREKHRDFRQDTRWADLEDDFAHSTYP